MNEKKRLILRLIATLVGVVLGYGFYFVGVVLGVAWSAFKTGFLDAVGKNPTHTPP